MKKIIVILMSVILFIVCVIAILFVFCQSKYDGYKQAELSDIGSLYIPEEWNCIREGDFVYITDDSFGEEIPAPSECLMLGVLRNFGASEYAVVSPYLEIKYIDSIAGEVYSNSVFLLERKVELNDEIVHMYLLNCYVTDEIRLTLFVLDNSIPFETLQLIGRSFHRVMEE